MEPPDEDDLPRAREEPDPDEDPDADVDLADTVTYEISEEILELLADGDDDAIRPAAPRPVEEPETSEVLQSRSRLVAATRTPTQPGPPMEDPEVDELAELRAAFDSLDAADALRAAASLGAREAGAEDEASPSSSSRRIAVEQQLEKLAARDVEARPHPAPPPESGPMVAAPVSAPAPASAAVVTESIQPLPIATLPPAAGYAVEIIRARPSASGPVAVFVGSPPSGEETFGSLLEDTLEL